MLVTLTFLFRMARLPIIKKVSINKQILSTVLSGFSFFAYITGYPIRFFSLYLYQVAANCLSQNEKKTAKKLPPKHHNPIWNNIAHVLSSLLMHIGRRQKLTMKRKMEL